MTKSQHTVTIEAGLGFSAYVTNDDHVHIHQDLPNGKALEIRLTRIEVRELCRNLPSLIAAMDEMMP